MFTLIVVLIVVVALALAPVLRVARSHTLVLVARRVLEGRHAPAWLAWRVARAALKAPLSPREVEVHGSPGTISELRERGPEIALWLQKLTYWGSPPLLSWHGDGQPGRRVILVPVSARSATPVVQGVSKRRLVPVEAVPAATAAGDSEAPTVHASQPTGGDGEVATVRRIVVEVNEPRVEERYVALEEGEWQIGRSAGCDLRLADPQVSRFAAILRVERDEVWALPAGSGVLLNSVPLIRPGRFRQDDVLTLAPGCVVLGRMMGRS